MIDPTEFEGCPLSGGTHRFYFQKTTKDFEPLLPSDAQYMDEILYRLVEYSIFACNCTKSYKVRINNKGL